MLSINQARQIIKDRTPKPAIETTKLEAILNRVLAENAVADMDLPPFDRSQMDGYAVRASDAKHAPVKLKIVGEAAAGASWSGELLRENQAVRIMTGASVPDGADAVQKQELTVENGEFVEIFEAVKAGQNIVPRASEIEAGKIVARAGETINQAMTGILAAFGYAQVAVGKRPRVSILSTGNEIVAVDQKPNADQIRNSNSTALKFYAAACGALVTELPPGKDDLESLKTAIKSAVEMADVVISTGGVSVGKYDFTKTALRELGAEILFEKVALRPGKPTVFAKLNETLIFGLPGNPVSAIVTFLLFVRPALLQMQGAKETDLKTGFAVLTHKLKGATERDSYLPAQLATDEKGRLLATPLRWGGSSDFISFARADALVRVPKNELFDAGSVVTILYLP